MISAAIIFFLLQDEIHGTSKSGNLLTLNRSGKAGIDLDQIGGELKKPYSIPSMRGSQSDSSGI
jgi:hypothetical protein